MHDLETLFWSLADSPTAPGWLQAWAAVLALFAVVLAAWLPIWSRRAEQIAAQRAIAVAADRILGRAVVGLRRTIEHFANPDNSHAVARDGPNFFLVERALAALDRLPSHELADDRLASLIERAATDLTGFLGFSEAFRRRAAAGWTRQDFESLRSLVDGLAQTHQEFTATRQRQKVR